MMETEEWPAPVRGWVQSGNLASAPKDAAEVLDNFFPTAQGVKLRRGRATYADLGAAVVRLFTYESTTSTLWASTAAGVFDAGRVNSGDNTFAEWEGLTSGDWAAVQMSTSGGEFMWAVNGADHGFYYDGTDIQPVVDETVIDLAFDAETADFTVGQTVTGGTSGASAEILGIAKTSATAGTLKIGAITSGPFQDNETITDGASGSATSNIPSGTSTASTVTVTGVATSALSQPWVYKERIFAVEKNTQSAWYLPVKSIGGAMTEINLGSVFRRGGVLLFGATWSLDSGTGLDDKCIFVSSLGEVAVYEGSNPSSASTWALIGVYDIGEPIDKHSWFRTGGDLAIITEDGIVPISQAIIKDRAALRLDAISFPIEDAWQLAVAQASASYPITATLWQNRTMLLVGVPTTDSGTNVAYVANARTGAWCRYTGWDVRCSAVSDDQLYFGSNDGIVYKAESGGSDAGTGYTGICVPKFSDAGPQNKFLTRARVLSRAPVNPTLKIKGLTNYQVPEISPPSTTSTADGPVWGTAVWGSFVWGGSSEAMTYSTWKKVNGKGYAVSLAALVTSNDTAAADVELVGFALRYERGTAL